MKRSWHPYIDSGSVRNAVGRVRRVLTPAVTAGLLCVPIPSHSKELTRPASVSSESAHFESPLLPRTAPIGIEPWALATLADPRTGGAVIEAWAVGTLADARQPDSESACDLSHVCALVISSSGGAGTGTGATLEGVINPPPQGELPPNLPFVLEEAIDYAHPVNKSENRIGITCYPANGALAVTVGPSTLNLGIAGQVCQRGDASSQVVLTGSYFTVAGSTGEFEDADGVGTVNINNPSGLPGSGKNAKASLAGQLKY